MTENTVGWNDTIIGIISQMAFCKHQNNLVLCGEGFYTMSC